MKQKEEASWEHGSKERPEIPSLMLGFGNIWLFKHNILQEIKEYWLYIYIYIAKETMEKRSPERTKACKQNTALLKEYMKLSKADAAGLSGSLKKQANNKSIVQEQRKL